MPILPTIQNISFPLSPFRTLSTRSTPFYSVLLRSVSRRVASPPIFVLLPSFHLPSFPSSSLLRSSFAKLVIKQTDKKKRYWAHVRCSRDVKLISISLFVYVYLGRIAEEQRILSRVYASRKIIVSDYQSCRVSYFIKSNKKLNVQN